jgi:hypothetical protein
MHEDRIYKGKLFDLICDNCCDYWTKRKNIKFLKLSGDMILVYTDQGKTIMFDKYDIRRWRIEYIKNKLQNNG